jgi:hypothetical protein
MSDVFKAIHAAIADLSPRDASLALMTVAYGLVLEKAPNPPEVFRDLAEGTIEAHALRVAAKKNQA